MNDTQDLHAQLAQRLFGWVDTGRRWDPQDPRRIVWQDPQGKSQWGLPAYTTDPAATARVWQWLEQQRGYSAWDITFGYWEQTVRCRIFQWTGAAYTLVHEVAPTWPEALCRAALALAEALEQGEEEG